jgi:hypothetical protein
MIDAMLHILAKDPGEQEDKPPRAEATRRLVELGLKAKPTR